MDAGLGSRIKALRMQEISGLAEEGQGVQKRNVITDVNGPFSGCSEGARKRRGAGNCRQEKEYEILCKDVKIAALSEVGWDDQRQEAFCTNSSYFSGIEHADGFFKRIHVEFARCLIGGTRMIVSRGLGKSHLPLRIFNLPELVIVRLTRCIK